MQEIFAYTISYKMTVANPRGDKKDPSTTTGLTAYIGANNMIEAIHKLEARMKDTQPGFQNIQPTQITIQNGGNPLVL
jgi:hypothetical protein